MKPDNVLVQASPEWWESASTLQYVDSQEEFNKYGADLDKYSNNKDITFYLASRKLIFLARVGLYNALFNFHFRFGPDFAFLRPGLEVKNACEAAREVGAKTTFLGSELDLTTWERLYHETRMNLPHYVMQRYRY